MPVKQNYLNERKLIKLSALTTVPSPWKAPGNANCVVVTSIVNFYYCFVIVQVLNLELLLQIEGLLVYLG